MEIPHYTFMNTITCPVCGDNFEFISVKAKTSRIISRDSDFFIRYSVINPYFYDVLICSSCGYSSMQSEFNKIKKSQIDLVKNRITPKWKCKFYPNVFTEEIAIQRYKLALLTAVLTDSKTSTKSMICLKTAWIYRLLDDTKNENILLQQALDGFQEVFLNEDLPVYGLDNFSLMYLIGELSRRLNRNDDALKWYSKTLTSLGSPYKIKELARDGRDKIKEL